MTAITDTRKRSREEDNSDFLPISKRINSLSINNQFIGSTENHQSVPIAQQHPDGNLLNYTNNTVAINSNDVQLQQYYNSNHATHMPNINQYQHQHQQQSNNNYLNNNNTQSHSGDIGTTNDSHIELSNDQSLDHHQQSDYMAMENYNPELTADENPFYYNKNKLLFDLHIEREKRNQNNH